MRAFWGGLTIGLIVVGFLVPIAWIAAIVTGMLAIGSAPAGTRADGKRKTGGLFGGIIDYFAIKNTTKECPHCRSVIKKEATKCPHCAEWLELPGETEKTVTCPMCRETFKIPISGGAAVTACPHCGELYSSNILR